MPSRYQFYKKEIGRHFIERRHNSSDRFYKEVLSDKRKRVMLFSGVGILSVLLAAAGPQLRKLMQIGILFALLPLPIISANRSMPKIANAYDVAKQGNPRKADKMVGDALDEFYYSVFQRFFKPLSFAVAITTLLTLPQNFAKEKTPWLALGKHYAKTLANKIGFKERFPTVHPQPHDNGRTLMESVLCAPLEGLNKLLSPKGTTFARWMGEKSEKAGWKHDLQPYPLLKRFNTFLRKQGDEWEKSLRSFRVMDYLLGKPPQAK